MSQLTDKIPDSFFVRAFIVRAAVLWFGVRMMIAFLGLPRATLLLPTGIDVSALVVMITVSLTGVEYRRRGEFLLLGSMGYAPGLLLGLSAIPVLPLEVAFTSMVA
jgi:hypothetical protein